MIVKTRENRDGKVANNFEFLNCTELISKTPVLCFTTQILNFEIETILSTQLILHLPGHLIVIIKGQHLF